VLAGRVAAPPSWDFVRVFVSVCIAHANATRRGLSVSADPEYWRREHHKLIELHRLDGRRDLVRTPPHPGRYSVANALTVQEVFLRQVPADGVARRIGVITGGIRQVRCAEVWVNSENTDMVMPRIQEFSVSSIIRYEGSKRDAAGRVVSDIIANELEAQVAELRPVGAGEVFVTGSGELESSNGVRFIVHVAAVYGEPGAGFRPVNQIGRCVDNALLAAERLDVGADAATGTSILFPLLTTGVGGGDVPSTARILIHTAINYLRTAPRTRIGTVLFLAYTDIELNACLKALDEVGDLEPVSAKRWLSAQRGKAERGVPSDY
jgi:O-acetyl-ADP-ribose deacetylase (regulator of RNase III)